MKKLLFVASILLALAASGQLKNNLPSSVQKFYLERANYLEMTKLPNVPNWASQTISYAQPRLIDGMEMIDAFIDIRDSSVIPSLKAAGVKVNCEFDGFVTAQIPMSRLDYVCGMVGVTNVEISRTVDVCTDTTLSVTHAGQLINGSEFGLPKGYDGTGVVVGIIDFGFDFRHRAFMRADNRNISRIVRVYNTADSTGHPVVIGGNTMPGTVFMGAQLDTMTTDDPSGYHGTHTASIAAGTHVNGYGGMAPGSDIVLCAPSTFKWGFLETEVLNCIKYIYSYADSVGKPCVISMSVSTPFGPHDGQDRISKTISQLVGPGRIFVIAAGNNGAKNFYAYGNSTPTAPMSILVGCDNSRNDDAYYYEHVQVDIWNRAKNTRPVCQFFILDKLTGRIVWKSNYITSYARIDPSEFSDYFEPDPANGTGYLAALISLNPNNYKFDLDANVHNLRTKSYWENDNGGRTSRYHICISVYPPSVTNPRLASSCMVDAWACHGRISRNNVGTVYVEEVNENGDTVTRAVNDYFRAPSDYVSIGTYAVADSIISAGGYIGRNCYYSIKNEGLVYDNFNPTVGSNYRYTSFQISGYGPTGKALPTVTAPAVNVVSAVSRYSSYAWGNAASMRDEYYNTWGALTGTSMAAPTVAGIIAQWLQIKPDLSPGDVKRIIAETSIKDSFTMSETGYRFGANGKIDAWAGAMYLLSNMVIPGDVNGDGFIGIDDIVRLIDYILYDITDNVVVEALDYNQDGLIDIVDVTDMIDYIVNPEE